MRGKQNKLERKIMVKETKYAHHPVRVVKGLSLGTEYMPGTVIVLDFLSAAKTGSLSDTAWSTWDVDSLFTGEDRPVNAVAVILDVEVNDSGSAGADTYLALATPGIIVDGKTQYLRAGDVDDRKAERLMIVEITGDGKIAVKAEASGANTLDYRLKLIGWLVAGTLTSHVTLPSVTLKAKFSVSH